MKLVIGEYEVEVKAKLDYKKTYSKEDTNDFLNLLAIICGDASRFEQGQGVQSFAKKFDKMDKDIYRFLSEQGVYD